MSYFEIGKIVNTQGLKGEVRVIPMTDDPKRFNALKSIEVFFTTHSKEYEIEKARLHKQFVVLKLKGVSSINEAEALRGGLIKISEENALPLEEDEYYIKDIYGLKVISDIGEELGVVEDIIFTGANDVYIVREHGIKDLLIPAIKQCILNIDKESKVMTVKLLEGLR